MDCRVAGRDVNNVLCIDRIVAGGRSRAGDMQDGLGSALRRAGRGSSMVVVEMYIPG